MLDEMSVVLSGEAKKEANKFFLMSALISEQLLVLPKSFRGSGKTESILEMSVGKKIPIVVASDFQAKDMREKFKNKFGYEYQGGFHAYDKLQRGFGVVIVDDLSVEQYEELTLTHKLKVVGFLHEDS